MRKEHFLKQLGEQQPGHAQYCNYDEVEKVLARRLKKLYARWYRIDGNVVVFKTFMDICKHMCIDMRVQISDIDEEVKKRVGTLQVLF